MNLLADGFFFKLFTMVSNVFVHETQKKIKSLSSEPKLKTVLEKRDCFDFLTVKWSTLNRPTSIVQL